MRSGRSMRCGRSMSPSVRSGRAARSWRSRGFGRSARSSRAPRSDRSPAAFSAASNWISAFFPTLAGSGPDPAFATLRDCSERSLLSGLPVGLPTSASRSCGLATSPSRSRASARSRAGGAAAGGSGRETCGAVTGGALRVGGAGGPVAGGGAISTGAGRGAGGATATTLRISVRTVRRSPRWLAGRGSTFAAGCGRGEAGGAPTTARPPSAGVVARAGTAVAIVESAAGRAVSTRARSARIREVSVPARACRPFFAQARDGVFEFAEAASQRFQARPQRVAEPRVTFHAAQRYRGQREDREHHAGAEQRRGDTVAGARRSPAPAAGGIGVAREAIADDECANDYSGEDTCDRTPEQRVAVDAHAVLGEQAPGRISGGVRWPRFCRNGESSARAFLSSA